MKSLPLPAIFAISWCIASYVVATILVVRGFDLWFVAFAPVTVPFLFLILSSTGNSEHGYPGNLELEVVVFTAVVIPVVAVLTAMRDDEGERRA